MASSLNTTATAASPEASSGGLQVPASAKGDWADAIANIEATAQSAAELVRPLSTSSTNVVPVKIGDSCTRILLRAKYPTGSAITTSPVVRVFALYGDPTSAGVFADDGTVKFLRLDATGGTTAGITITLDTTNDLKDSTYQYSSPWSLDLLDARGAKWILVLLETAAVHAGAGGTIEVLGLN